MKKIFNSILLLALTASLSTHAQEPSPLAKSKAIYEKSLQKIEADYQTKLKPLNDAYYKSLMTTLKKMPPQQNLWGDSGSGRSPIV